MIIESTGPPAMFVHAPEVAQWPRWLQGWSRPRGALALALEIQDNRSERSLQSGQVWLALDLRIRKLGHPHGVQHHSHQAIHGLQSFRRLGNPRQQEIHAERDRKLKAGRKQRQIRREQAA
jgi:hypothetical protein